MDRITISTLRFRWRNDMPLPLVFASRFDRRWLGCVGGVFNSKRMILGIDPGPKESAYCVWDGAAIKNIGIIPSIEICGIICNTDWVVAVEHLQSFGMAVGKEVFETAYWIGEFRRECRFNRLEFVPVYRKEVKVHHCESIRATDSNIRCALIDRFGPPGTKKAPGLTYGLKKDMWSAFAIAVMVHDNRLPLQSPL